MEKEFICSTTEPIVQTVAGKIRGFQLGSTYTFYGIKYANAKRWQMPTPVAPWEGVKDALSYGYIAPMPTPDSPMGDLMVPHRFWPQNEDCQYLNVWTQSLSKDAKKPVLFWIHGGGFSSGSSIEMVAYDGNNLSEFGDVVVVSLNHRLNLLGWMDVSAFGGKEYENSANVGLADIVAALQWVKDNIAAFGGDPDNVTIFGQSGGGGKIANLLQTPCAKGLFHKAVIQSSTGAGTPNSIWPADERKKFVEDMMAAAGLKSFDEMVAAPFEVLAKAHNQVLKDRGIRMMNWQNLPGDYFKGAPLDIGAIAELADVPVMVGSNFSESFSFGPSPVKLEDMPMNYFIGNSQNTNVDHPNKYTLTEEGREAVVRAYYGDEYADKMIPLFKKSFPDHNLVDLIYLDSTRKHNALAYMDELGKANVPLWSYLFAPDFPLDDGRLAWHCAEMPFVFHNVDKVAYANIPEADRLEKEVASAWVNFARTGNPGWEPFVPGKSEYTMVFDREKSESRLDLDRELNRLVCEACEKRGLRKAAF